MVPLIKKSPELRAVTRRFLESIQAKDAEALTNLLSASDHVRYIGSDQGEVWAGKALRSAYPRHAEQVPKFSMDIEDIEAFEEGTVGWSALVGIARFEGGSDSQFRMTFVYLLEAGAWRIVQAHLSVPVPNVTTTGVELTSSLEALLASFESHVKSLPGTDAPVETATIMFTDIEGSVEISGRIGDRAWVDLIARHNDAVRRAIESENGIVIKTLGDGTMATFDSARSALKAAASIQRGVPRVSDELRVRIGLHTGDVVRTEGDLIGHAVSKAARIASVAEGGQVLVSRVTRSLVGDSTDHLFGTPSTYQLKGLDGTHELSPVIV